MKQGGVVYSFKQAGIFGLEESGLKRLTVFFWIGARMLYEKKLT